MSTGGGFVLEKDKVVPGWERVSGETDGWVVFFFPCGEEIIIRQE